MKYFYDIYLRPAADFDYTGAPAANILDGWDKLDYPKGSKLSLTTEVEELDDGTGLGVAHKATLETTTLKVDKDEYDYLLTTFHNTVCDAILMDANAMGLAFAVLRIRMKVEKVAESGGDRYIKISGAANIPNAAIDSRFQVINWDDEGTFGFIEGYITSAAGAALEGAIVSMTGEDPTTYTDTTDKTGFYMAMVPVQGYAITAVLPGHTFPEAAQVVVAADQITQQNIQATA